MYQNLYNHLMPVAFSILLLTITITQPVLYIIRRSFRSETFIYQRSSEIYGF